MRMNIDRSSTSNRQDQSSLECRLEHIPIYSWIESNFSTLRITLNKRGFNENEIEEKEQTLINNLKVQNIHLLVFSLIGICFFI